MKRTLKYGSVFVLGLICGTAVPSVVVRPLFLWATADGQIAYADVVRHPGVNVPMLNAGPSDQTHEAIRLSSRYGDVFTKTMGAAYSDIVGP